MCRLWYVRAPGGLLIPKVSPEKANVLDCRTRANIVNLPFQLTLSCRQSESLKVASLDLRVGYPQGPSQSPGLRQ